LDFFDKEEKMKLEDLHEKYPVIFSHGRSFEHSHGWYKLLDELCSQLTTIMNNIGIVITAEQVKEKFGTLRFYCSVDFPKDLPDSDAKNWNDIIRSLISRAEMMSGYTCERCGERGKVRPGGWIKTLCDKCDSKELEVSTTEMKEQFKELKKEKEASNE
jgi:hypothetical protein